MRVAVVGGGLAGALLAWRLRQASTGVAVEVLTGGSPPGGDATGASGGLVRGFELDAAACRVAAESLAELRGSQVLRRWAGYREIGSVFLPARPAAPFGESVRTVEELLPGSVAVVGAGELALRYPFRELPDGTVGVVERYAGYLSPARLRSAVLAELGRCSVAVRALRVAGVTPAPAVRLADGTTLRYDAVVVAAGAWTPRLLAASGPAASGPAESGPAAGGPAGHGFRTKHIQYSLHAAGPPGLPAFVDASDGLYGRPADGGSLLIGLPSDRWDVDPDAVEPDHGLAARALASATRRLAGPITPHPQPRIVAAFDCYHPRPGLRLRPVGEAGVPLFTFTGGSGGAAKTVLAASRAAASDLLAPRVEVVR